MRFCDIDFEHTIANSSGSPTTALALEQEQQWSETHRPSGSNNGCPFCSTPLSEAEFERAYEKFQKASEDSVRSSSSVKYLKTMRSVRSAHGTEIMSVKEQYERFGNSALVRAAVALNSYFATAAAKSRAGAAFVRRKYAQAEARLKQQAKRLASKVTRWFNKWVFFIFKRAEEGLSKVSG